MSVFSVAALRQTRHPGESWRLGAQPVIRRYTAMFKEPGSIEKRDIKILRAQLLVCLLLKQPKNKPDAKREDLERHGFGG